MKTGVVDIGTNSIRLLITEGESVMGRWVEITGLGRGVDASGFFSEDAIAATLEVLADFGDKMNQLGVELCTAIATSASRDSSNRDVLFDAAEDLLGVRPELISGQREGELAFKGAISDMDLAEPVVVSDIGGGSTEIVTSGAARSIDIGSVRLSDRALPQRPPSSAEIDQAWALLSDVFSDLEPEGWRSHVGVAGTWTSVAAIAMDLPAYEGGLVHGSRVTRTQVAGVVDRLAPLTLGETEAIPGLDPRRAPVILAGAMVAVMVMDSLGVATTIVSERDTLDGAAMELAGIA